MISIKNKMESLTCLYYFESGREIMLLSAFRQGLFHLLELSQKPIFIVFQSQQKHVSVDIMQDLRNHQARTTTVVWGAHSVVSPPTLHPLT